MKDVAGHKFFVWELPPNRANEALDRRVYAYGALCGLIHFGYWLNAQVQRVALDYADHASGVYRISGPPVASASPGGTSLVSQLA